MKGVHKELTLAGEKRSWFGDKKWLPWAVGGTAVAALTVGAIVFLKYKSKQQ
jgi:hypothetical protein